MEVELSKHEKDDQSDDADKRFYDSEGENPFECSWNKIASRDIAKYVGKFPKWGKLPTELQMIIISNMDYKTRTRLSFCSKKDYATVSSSFIEMRCLIVDDSGSRNRRIAEDSIVNFERFVKHERIDSVFIEIDFKNNLTVDGTRTMRLFFIKRGNDMEVMWVTDNVGNVGYGNKSTSKLFTNCDYYGEAVKFVEKWLKKSKFAVKNIFINMKRWPFEQSEIQFLSNCEEIDIKHDDEEALRWWLAKVRPELKKLKLWLCGKATTSEQLLSMDHFKKCNYLYAYGSFNFTDQQFLSMTAECIVSTSDAITDRGINQFIKKWATGKLSDDFRFFHIYRNRTTVKQTILKDISFRQWDEHFERDQRRFCEQFIGHTDRGDLCQIDKMDNSGTSATLNLYATQIAFCVTGRRIEEDGITSINYTTPFEFWV